MATIPSIVAEPMAKASFVDDITVFRSPSPNGADALAALTATLVERVPRKFGRIGLELGEGTTARFPAG